jgi:DNA-binding SARP family transcriptional activator
VIPTLHIYLLGEFRLVSGEVPVTTIDLPRLQSFLAYLVLHHETPVPRAQIAFQLWPDSTDAQAYTNLRTLVHRLRHALPGAEHFLRVERQTLQWQVDTQDVTWTLDVQEFELAIQRVEQAKDPRHKRQALEEAVALYRGDLLPGSYEEWVLPERDRLYQLLLTAMEHLIALLEQERDYRAAITVAQGLLRHDPLHEATYRDLMRLYAVSGDRATALRTYHTCATILERELATEPGQMTRVIYERIMQADDTTDIATQRPAVRGSGSPLVGRHQEWRRLQEIWQQGRSPHMVVLSG